MKIDQIIVLRTILEEGSFRSASLKLHRAQSAISYAIRNLEAELGFKIFDRAGYRPLLTPQGKAYLKRTDQVLESLKDLEAYAKTLRQGCEPQLRLSVTALIPLQKLVNSFAQLKWRFPSCELKLAVDVLSGDRLLQGDQVDLAISDVKGKDDEVEAVKIGEILMKAVVSRKRQTQDLQDLPQIIIKSSSYAGERSAGIVNKNSTWSVPDFTSKKELIAADLGWGFVPEHLLGPELKVMTLPMKPVEISLLKLKNKPLGPAAKFLWETFQDLSL